MKVPTLHGCLYLAEAYRDAGRIREVSKVFRAMGLKAEFASLETVDQMVEFFRRLDADVII